MLLSPGDDTSKFTPYLGPKHSTFNGTPSDARNWHRDDATISRRSLPSLPPKASREEGDGSSGLFSTTQQRMVKSNMQRTETELKELNEGEKRTEREEKEERNLCLIRHTYN